MAKDKTPSDVRKMIKDSNVKLIDFFFAASRRRHTRSTRDWSSDVCSSDLGAPAFTPATWPLALLAASETGVARSPFARLTLSSFEPLDCKSLDVAAGTGLPDSWIVQVIERLPVLLSVSVFVRVWSAGTMNW